MATRSSCTACLSDKRAQQFGLLFRPAIPAASSFLPRRRAPGRLAHSLHVPLKGSLPPFRLILGGLHVQRQARRLQPATEPAHERGHGQQAGFEELEASNMKPSTLQEERGVCASPYKFLESPACGRRPAALLRALHAWHIHARTSHLGQMLQLQQPLGWLGTASKHTAKHCCGAHHDHHIRLLRGRQADTASSSMMHLAHWTRRALQALARALLPSLQQRSRYLQSVWSPEGAVTLQLAIFPCPALPEP